MAQNKVAYPPVALNDRDYFVAQQDSPNVGLYFSHPYRSRLRDGKWSVSLTRRINNPDGSFNGIAVLAIRLEYFQSLLSRISTGSAGSVFIALDDGTLLARKPYVEKVIGIRVRSASFAYMQTHPSGSFVAKATVDGVERMYSFSRVPGTPLIAVVAPAVDDILSPWRERSLLVGTLTLAFGGVFVAVSWMLAFALRDKIRVQEQLMRWAATDALTGLSNRRALDARLDAEWTRAARQGSAISVAFVDIDHFKRFNDLYGHAMGDDVLSAVADCLTEAARASDVVVRYGGEEFAVLLPDTDAAGAIAAAERMRKNVEGMTHFALTKGQPVVTVSVGCATRLPALGGAPRELLLAADEQLYSAKGAGRNRVMHEISATDSFAVRT
ncbi:sensor domain-containing diguanylate cyclase [Paraburkholderia madseniana]|uniref:sensor domain-containing diguanylate cyclase n=1 Tax=Paraburkholderia madseniana TaxID=2599607 RepID=UPI0038BC22E5